MITIRKRKDRYLWTKNRIKFLYEKVRSWNDGEIRTPKHGIWSIKKLIALDYYIEPYVKIIRKSGFKNYYYVDPFCGAGLLQFRSKYPFPGSPLIPLFRMERTPFTKYIMSDRNVKFTNALSLRVSRILDKQNQGLVNVAKMDFLQLTRQVFSGIKPTNWKDNAFFVFLDPFGLQVDWKSMERILCSGAVDVIFTFMTWAISWNKNKKLSEKAIMNYFGDDNWKSLNSQEDFVNDYCMKIEKLGYSNKYKTFPIDVIQEGGNRYDLILATQSTGGANVLNDLKKVVSSVTTQTIDDAFSVAVGDRTDLDSFINEKFTG